MLNVSLYYLKSNTLLRAILTVLLIYSICYQIFFYPYFNVVLPPFIFLIISQAVSFQQIREVLPSNLFIFLEAKGSTILLGLHGIVSETSSHLSAAFRILLSLFLWKNPPIVTDHVLVPQPQLGRNRNQRPWNHYRIKNCHSLRKVTFPYSTVLLYNRHYRLLYCPDKPCNL